MIYRILQGNPKKELLRGLWVIITYTTVDDRNPALPLIKECTILPHSLGWVLKVMQIYIFSSMFGDVRGQDQRKKLQPGSDGKVFKVVTVRAWLVFSSGFGSAIACRGGSI